MQKNTKIKRLTLLLVVLFAGTSTYFANGQPTSPSEAIRLFDAGKYEAAEDAFQQLLQQEPGNTMLNYYYGASRTENGHFSEEDLNFLLKAGREVTPLRIHYYLGVQYHAMEKWDLALKHYNQYRVSAPPEEQEEFELAQKIQQCFDRKNPFRNDEAEEKTVSASSGSSTGDEQTEPGMTKKEEPAEKDNEVSQLEKEFIAAPLKILPDLPGVKPTASLPTGEPIEFQVNSNITYSNTEHFHTEEGKEIFLEGKALKDKLENNMEKADELRKKYNETTDPDRKAMIGQTILSYEKNAFQLKEKINELFSVSRKLENQYWQNAGETAMNNFLVKQKKVEAVQKARETAHQDETSPMNRSLLIPSSDFLRIPGLTFSRTPESEPPPLVYKIQIGAYSRGLPAYVKRQYDKLSMIRKIENYTDENGVVVYTTGNLTNLEDAIKMQNQVRQEGIKDAFVVPYFKGKRITLERAKKIEGRNDLEKN